MGVSVSRDSLRVRGRASESSGSLGDTREESKLRESLTRDMRRGASDLSGSLGGMWGVSKATACAVRAERQI